MFLLFTFTELSLCHPLNYSTFENDISLDNAVGNCEHILNMPSEEARELMVFAKHQGFSCLGTWTRDECLSLGMQLQSQGLNCRVVPLNEERDERGWQSKVGDRFPTENNESIAYLQGLSIDHDYLKSDMA